MGSSHSAERLHVPLHAQAKPFLATENGCVAETFTSLRAKVGSFTTSRIKIFDAQTAELMFEIKYGTLTSRRNLQTPYGRVMMSMKAAGAFASSKQRVYNGDQTERESFHIDWEINTFNPGPMFVFATFNDRLTGEPCRVTIEGNSDDRVAIAYLERGEPTLLPLDKHAERACDRKRYQPIGRIRQPKTPVFEEEDYFVEAAPGVDLTLMLLLWLVRYEFDTTN